MKQAFKKIKRYVALFVAVLLVITSGAIISLVSLRATDSQTPQDAADIQTEETVDAPEGMVVENIDVDTITDISETDVDESVSEGVDEINVDDETAPVQTQDDNGIDGPGSGLELDAQAEAVLGSVEVGEVPVDQITVTFNSNHGSGTIPSVVVPRGEQFALPGAVGLVGPLGEIFAGWSDSPAYESGGNIASSRSFLYQPGDLAHFDRDTTLYAVWAGRNVSATFYVVKNGQIPAEPGSFSASDYTQGVYVPSAVKAARYTYLSGASVNDYLNCWPTAEDFIGETVRDNRGNEVQLTASNVNRYEIVWYVIKQEGSWHVDGTLRSKSNVFITYNSNADGEFVSGMPRVVSERYNVNNTVNVASSVPARSGYCFLGWNTAADGSGTMYHAADTFTITQDVTLYAVWQRPADRVTVNVDWSADAAIADHRPESVTVVLQSSTDGVTYTDVAPELSVQLTAESGWKCTFTDLDQRDENGQQIFYRVREVLESPADYWYEVSYRGDHNQMITNILTAEPEEWTIVYTWDGDVPEGEYAVELPVDDTVYLDGEHFYVDTEYGAGYVIPTFDEYGNHNGDYEFSGWDTGNGQALENLTINGTWTYHEVEVASWTITYAWTGDVPGGADALPLPVDTNRYVNGSTFVLDTTYYEGYVHTTYYPNGDESGHYVFSGWQIDEPETGSSLEDMEFELYSLVSLASYSGVSNVVTENLVIKGTWSFESVAQVTYGLTIHYVDEQGNAVAPDYTGRYAEQDAFVIASPLVAGMTTNMNAVASPEGGMPAQDLEFTVVYTVVPEGDADTPVRPVGPGGTVEADAQIVVDENGNYTLVELEPVQTPTGNIDLGADRHCILHILIILAAVVIFVTYIVKSRGRKQKIKELSDEIKKNEK